MTRLAACCSIDSWSASSSACWRTVGFWLGGGAEVLDAEPDGLPVGEAGAEGTALVELGALFCELGPLQPLSKSIVSIPNDMSCLT